MSRTAETDQICRSCWDRAVWAFGTAKVFSARADRYRRYLKRLAYVAIGVPVLIGGTVLSFGLGGDYLPVLLTVGGLAGILQLGVSVCSLVADWTGSLEYSLVSASDNYDLATKFRDLGSRCAVPPDDLPVRFAELRGRDDSRRTQDVTKGVAEREKRFGHRAGLLQFQRECTACHKVPSSMEPTKCGVCGRF